MPSTLVHLGVGALVAAALLGPAFGPRALAVVLGATAVPDLDTVLGLWIEGGHRTLLHTALLPLALGIALAWDLRYRETSAVRRRYGDPGARIAAVSVVALAVAGIAPDFVTNGVNVLYPVRDQFVHLDGELLLSNQRGIVQTFVEFQTGSPDGAGGGPAVGTPVGNTSTSHYETGVDPSAGAEAGSVERTFYVLQSGMDLLLVLLGAGVATARLAEDRQAR